MRRAAVVVMALAACGESRVATSASHFTAEASGGMNVTLAGAARFWCVDRPLEMCAVHLYPEGDHGDSINFTITNTTRPKAGTYGIDAELDPSAQSFRVNYISGKRGGHQNFVGKSGKVVIDRSSAGGVEASFEWEGLGVDPVNGAYPPIRLRGSFVAECQLHLRAAYTCD